MSFGVRCIMFVERRILKVGLQQQIQILKRNRERERKNKRIDKKEILSIS